MWKKKINYLIKASLFVPPQRAGSEFPVCMLTLEEGEFSKPSPIPTRFFRFSFVAMSTDELSPVKFSAWAVITKIRVACYRWYTQQKQYISETKIHKDLTWKNLKSLQKLVFKDT